VREQPVIIDADVASLYGVETKRVNEAVRNNPEKFPGDYMFELTELEVRDLRSKISSAKSPPKSRAMLGNHDHSWTDKVGIGDDCWPLIMRRGRMLNVGAGARPRILAGRRIALCAIVCGASHLRAKAAC